MTRSAFSILFILSLMCAASIARAQGQAQTSPQQSAIVDRIRSGRPLRLGFRTDARPFAYTDTKGRPAGYSISLCERIVTAAKREFGLASLPLEWVPLAPDSHFQTLGQGKIDIICGAEAETVARREQASFSIPIFPGGIGVLVRADATRLKEVLSGRQMSRPIWQAAAMRTVQARAFSIVEGTTSENWLSARMRELEVIANVTTVKGYDDGIQAVIDRRSDAFFGERAILLEAGRRYAHTGDVAILERQFSYERLALAIPRGDEAFRLLVDRVLSQLYTSGEIGLLYAGSFGEPDANALAFFQLNTLR